MVNKEKGCKFVDKTYYCEGVGIIVPGSLKNADFIVRSECLCLVSLFYIFVPLLYSYYSLFFLTFIMLVKYMTISISTGLYPTLDLWPANK